MPTEKEMMEQLRRGKLSLPPLSLRLLQVQAKTGGDNLFDAFVQASWRDNKARFAVEFKSIWTPKVSKYTLDLLKTSRLPKGYLPMLIMPFLGEPQLQELERLKISGIDLCGNGVVIVPGRFAVYRSGEKNRFPSSASIKNIYRKNSSMVGRVFLARSCYATVQAICTEVNQRNLLVQQWGTKPMGLSTVSKSLKTLDEDLIVTHKAAIRLLQADKLLENLSENFVPPKIKERVRLKVAEAEGTILEWLWTQSRELGLPLVVTGTSSVTQYAAMQRGDLLSVYCPRLEMLLERLPGSQADRFPNIELIETEDETVFFDARQQRNVWWASPVQVYLELMAGDKRDQETAEQVKSFILRNVQPEQS